MQIGERVRHNSRPDLGTGCVTRVHEDGRCDVAFPGCTFSGVSLKSFTSVAAEEAIRQLKDLLHRGRFEEATSLHQRNSQYLTGAEFEALLTRARTVYADRIEHEERLRIAQERQRLRGQVQGHLSEGNFDDADTLYRASCADWWPSSEFTEIRRRAVRIADFIARYPDGQLADLDAHYGDGRDGCLSADDYAWLKLPKLELRLAHLGMPMDEEQLQACARPERHRLIRARAGSGKTRTLAALAALTIYDEALSPDQVLVLAFNKKAASEIGDRIRSAAAIDEFRSARTFHSLAWQLADHAGRELIFDDGNLAPSRRRQTGFVERLIESMMNPAFRERLYEFFRRELEQLDRLGSVLPKQEYLAWRRAMADYTLGGETVKSNGEKFIADFLFEHGIPYRYEKVWSWDKQDRLRADPYRPDFSIADGGRDVILEHWAVDPQDRSAQVPDWWKTDTRAYIDQIEAKRQFCEKRGIVLLETHTGMLRRGRGVFEGQLKQLLEGAGIRCRKLGHDELVDRVAAAPRTVSRMAELFVQFISRAKKRGWTVDDVAAVIRDAPDAEPRSRAFHEIAVHAYAAYERQLAAQSSMDFDDLLISAAECVRADGGAARLQLDRKTSIAIRDLRWILIDEFQDFSELYYGVIDAILEANPSIRVVAVGDDWQAINGFAGAQLKFFNAFADHFSGAGTATVSKNRRSGRAIVGAGNQLMAGRGPPALAHNDFGGEIDVVAADKVWVERGTPYAEIATSVRHDGRTSVNWEFAQALKACVDYIVGSVFMDSARGLRWMPSVLILARTGHAYGENLATFGEGLQRALREHPALQDLANDFAVRDGVRNPAPEGATPIEVMTAHKSKGKEADTVIVLEATTRQFPKVHADNQLFGPFGVTAEDVLADERRLFYVAVTRAEHRLLILTETGMESPYLEVMRRRFLADISPEGNGRRLSKDALHVGERLDRIDRELLIRRNVSTQAVSAWDSVLSGRSPGVPVVGHFLAQDLYAELAWPSHEPPLAVLTGRHRAQADRWRQEGWHVY